MGHSVLVNHIINRTKHRFLHMVRLEGGTKHHPSESAREQFVGLLASILAWWPRLGISPQLGRCVFH
jgi:hypothetical protein